MKYLIWIISILLISNTALAIEETIVLVDYNKNDVQACQEIETLQGPTGYRMVGPPSAMAKFKASVKEEAESTGATHIVWSYVDSGLERTLYGKVYNCNNRIKNTQKYHSKLLNY